MPTEKQRREAARRHLERQLQRRQERDARRRRITLIISVAGTLVVIAVIVIAITVIGGSNNSTTSDAANPSTSSAATTPATSPVSSPTPPPSTSYRPATGKTVTFDGVTVKGATDLKGYPQVTSKASKAPAKLEYKDLVVGKGKAASPTSTVTVQYVGVRYADGKTFDSSWDRGQPAQFSLTGVVPGFTQGIGGTKDVPPMKVGGRRIMILPASLGYGTQSRGADIPPNTPLVFVVDLVSVQG